MKYINFNILFIIGLSCLLFTEAQAQVTIGSGEEPAKGTLLDLKQETQSNGGANSKKGLGLPRVALEAVDKLEPCVVTNTENALLHKGLTVYNTTNNSNTLGTLVEGVYVWDGTIWQAMGLSGTFFYLPSFNLDISSVGNKQIDLYKDVYKKQFTREGNTKFVSSNNSLPQVSTILSADKLDFVVTDYSDTVITVNSISPEGIMDYDVLTINGSGAYINIILRVK